MLTITIPAVEKFNEATNEFIHYDSQTLALEHSLLSISKWEQENKVPFPLIQTTKLKTQITPQQLRDYVRCMTLTQNVKPEVYDNLSRKNIEKILKYINDPMTGTTFSKRKAQHGKHPSITNEVVYYWMASNGIWKECEKWHFNRLMTLINVFNDKGSTGNKMNNSELVAYYRELNEKRLAAAKRRAK